MAQRDYQLQSRSSILTEWQEVDSTLLVLPTGMGKTVVMADVIRCRFPYRALVVAHRKELIYQARDKIQTWAKLPVEIEMGEYKAQTGGGLFRRSSVVVTSIQTMVAGGDGGGRMGKFDPMDFRTLIVDEAHHATSPSYRRFMDYMRTNPNMKILGMTATPDRSDEEALGQVFDTVAFSYEILDGIKNGWLVPIEQLMVNVNSLDLSNVRTCAGDLNGADLAAILETEKNLQGIAIPTIEIIGHRSALVFTATVMQAVRLSEIFNRYKPGMSNWVSGATDPDERIKTNADFDSGRIQVLCNCGTHTEGYDSSRVEVIIMAKPTKSRSLYAQMVGRATRTLPGIVDRDGQDAESRREAIAGSSKPSCLVVDFVGNSGRHKLMTTADLLGGNVSDEVIAVATLAARNSGRPVRMEQLLLDEQERQAEIEQRRLEDEARRHKLTAKASYSTSSVDPFNLLHLSPVVSRGWDSKKQYSELQRVVLKRNGVDPDKLEYSRGKQLIGELFHRREMGLATLSQVKTLRKFGVADPDAISFATASKVIDAIAKNCWRKPSNLAEIIANGAKPKAPEPVAAGNSSTYNDDDIPF